MRKYKATVLVIIMVMLIPFTQSCLNDYDDDIYDIQAEMPFNAALATVSLLHTAALRRHILQKRPRLPTPM